jgi:hypothetical protein
MSSTELLLTSSSRKIRKFLRVMYYLHRVMSLFNVPKIIRVTLSKFLVDATRYLHKFGSSFSLDERRKKRLLAEILDLQSELVPTVMEDAVLFPSSIRQKAASIFKHVEKIISTAEPRLITPYLKLDKCDAIYEIIKDYLPRNCLFSVDYIVKDIILHLKPEIFPETSVEVIRNILYENGLNVNFSIKCC